MNKREKELQEKAWNMFEAMDESRLHCSGGYPCIVCTDVPGYVIVASTKDENDNEPTLDIYTEESVLNWWKNAKAEQVEYPDTDWADALFETMPEPFW
jgi:hypothetical protein